MGRQQEAAQRRQSTLQPDPVTRYASLSWAPGTPGAAPWDEVPARNVRAKASNIASLSCRAPDNRGLFV